MLLAKTGLVFAVLCVTACARDNSNAPTENNPARPGETAATAAPAPVIATKERDFVDNLGNVQIAELNLSALAVERATDPSVRNFARESVDRLNTSFDKITRVADKKGLQRPAPTTAAQQKYADISKLTGEDFERAYMTAMKTAHDQEVALIEAEVEKGKDADVVALTRGRSARATAYRDGFHSIIRLRGKRMATSKPLMQKADGTSTVVILVDAWGEYLVKRHPDLNIDQVPMGAFASVEAAKHWADREYPGGVWTNVD